MHPSSRKEGREDTGIPCISASVLRDVVDPGGGDDLPSLACAAVRNDLSETGRRGTGGLRDSPLEGNGFEILVPRCLATANSVGAFISAGEWRLLERRNSS